MVRPPSEPWDDTASLPMARPYLAWWVRGILLVMALGLGSVLGLAVYLNPYQEDGTPRTMETHRQLGLPPCTFKTVTGGFPCPSCGMTTSFSLLMHGDVLNSLRANWVGTLLGAYCLVLVPWGLASVVLRRPLFVISLDRVLSWSVVMLMVLMLLRWGAVLALLWWQRRTG